MFQSLRANNQLYILHKDANPYIEIGSVVSVSAPKPKYPMPTPIGQIPQTEMVVDIVININGQTQPFRIFRQEETLQILDRTVILYYPVPVMQ